MLMHGGPELREGVRCCSWSMERVSRMSMQRVRKGAGAGAYEERTQVMMHGLDARETSALDRQAPW
jgi:hypothetical protein